MSGAVTPPTKAALLSDDGEMDLSRALDEELLGADSPQQIAKSVHKTAPRRYNKAADSAGIQENPASALRTPPPPPMPPKVSKRPAKGPGGKQKVGVGEVDDEGRRQEVLAKFWGATATH